MSGTEVERQRTWRPDWPCSVTGPLRPLRRGAGDPTFRIDDAGQVWRGTRTPEGPATLRVGSAPSVGEVRASAWGPGACTECTIGVVMWPGAMAFTRMPSRPWA